MNVSTIQMNPEDARAKLEAYREALAGRHSQAVEEEYMAALRGYEALAKGTPLIDPISSIREAGWRPDARPALAIARADRKMVRWSAERTQRRWNSAESRWQGQWCPMEWLFDARRSDGRRGPTSLTFTVTGITLEPPGSPKSGSAMVPMVPPDVLPSGGCDLSKHFILWEVENWDVAPPIDPILLKPLGGDLYAVVAQWDLTELERKIIAGTRR